MIPNEAIEAGYQAVGYLAIGRDEIRAILEAAHPHMVMSGDPRYWAAYKQRELGEWQQ